MNGATLLLVVLIITIKVSIEIRVYLELKK